MPGRLGDRPESLYPDERPDRLATSSAGLWSLFVNIMTNLAFICTGNIAGIPS